MKVDEVMAYRRAVPFKPFLLKLKDGREFIVREPEHIGRDAGLTRITVAADDESFETFAGDVVDSVSVVRPGGASAGGRKRGRKR